MSTLVIVGAQWGDEAKGKLVDVLGAQADVVVRYSGGNNAGHTVVVGDRLFKFHLLPAGILHSSAVAVLGSGMVICPKGLLEELDRTAAQLEPSGDGLGELKISGAAHVVFPYHRLLDGLEEEARGQNKIGTTSRGIGPAYQDKVARLGIRMWDFVQPELFRSRLAGVLAYKNRLIELLGGAALPFEAMHEEYSAYAERLRPYVTETEPFIQEAVRRGKRVLFEGAQGALLDLDSGTYPYVTSSHPVAGGACIGTGIGPRDIGAVLGVCKAYATRVGAGPFPTELHDAIGEHIREHGKEYGTTTGRGRRVGWLDLVALRQSCRLNSLSGLVMTRLDILSGFEEIKVCTRYRLGDKELDYVPSSVEAYEKVEPIYEELPGWSGDLRSARSIEDLPAQARSYVRLVEDFTETPAAILSVGPDRDETIILRPEQIWNK